jgi:hypothetical protein
MKLVLLAAAAALAFPAMAQTTTDTQTDTSTQTQTQDQTDTATDQTAPAQDQSTTSTGQAAAGAMTPGGYAPATPPMAGPAPAGATVQFVPSQSPDQAFPPPPAQASYPWCRPGQFDNCRERENARGQGLHHQHRR